MSHSNRGFEAEHPTEIPPLGWWDIAKRSQQSLSNENLSLIAAGVAFYALLAIFPAMAAIVSIYAYFASATQVEQHVAALIELLPSSGREIITAQLTQLTAKSSATLSLSAIGTLLLTVWSSSKGCQALITACNISYLQRDKRQFFIALLVRFVFSVGAICVAIVAMSIIGILPIVLDLVGLRQSFDYLIQGVTWLCLALTFNLAMAVLYRYAPHRRAAKWRWVTPGSLLATVLWILSSLGFSFYVSHFASYNETYGSLGGVVIMLMWLYISAYIIILGAVFNANIEQQTTKDTTHGQAREVGERGAFVADHLTAKQRDNQSKG